MALLNKDQILAADDIKYKIVEVPEWGGEVRVKGLTGTERDEFEAKSIQTKNGQRKENLENFRARLVALCVVDEDGRRLFVSPFDVAQLGRKSVAALQRVFNACQELNALTDEDVEDLTEDFEEAPDEASISG